VCIVNFILDILPTASPAQPHDGGGESSRNGINDPDSRAADEIKQLRMRLCPLREVEAILSRRLAMGKCPSGRTSAMTPGSEQSSFRPTEIVVRSGSGWKALSKLRGPSGQDQINEMRQIIAACHSDITSLWENEIVQSTILDNGEFHEHPTTL